MPASKGEEDPDFNPSLLLPPSSSTLLSMSEYIRRLERQASAIEELQSSIFQRLKEARRNEAASISDEYFAAVSQCFTIVKAAYDTKPDNLEEILEKGEEVLSQAVIFAYRGSENPMSETQVFSQFPSFAHEDGSRPLIKWAGLPEGSRRQSLMFLCVLETDSLCP
jgi:type II secretory pathway component PulJ